MFSNVIREFSLQRHSKVKVIFIDQAQAERQRRVIIYALIILSVLALLFLNNHADASTAGSGMPWEGVLQKIRDSITGPVAFTISILGIVAAGAGLIFGGAEMSGFMKTLISLALVIAIIIGAQNLLSSFSGSGAVITVSSLQMQMMAS